MTRLLFYLTGLTVSIGYIFNWDLGKNIIPLLICMSAGAIVDTIDNKQK